MKRKISVSIDQGTLEKVQEHIQSGRFRSTSHALEYAIRRIMESKQ